MHEVYEVCKRLKAAGFPQEYDDNGFCLLFEAGIDRVQPRTIWPAKRFPLEEYHTACPNASECMRFAREKWPGCRMGVMDMVYGGQRFRSEIWDAVGTSQIVSGEHPDDPDQAARLALAAALEADHVAK